MEIDNIVSSEAEVGENTRIWHHAQVREGAVIGKDCIISKNCYIDHDVEIGDNCKIQNNVSVYYGVTLKEGVFVGPHVCFTNDRLPRAINPDGTPKKGDDWTVSKTMVKEGASIGANSTIMPVTIGSFSLIGAGSIVTKDVPDHAIAFGNPAKVKGYICKCGKTRTGTDQEKLECKKCGTELDL